MLFAVTDTPVSADENGFGLGTLCLGAMVRKIVMYIVFERDV